MDLPTSSYHDSLEELWDEEKEPEEIESMMEVVNSVYHQYLDVFSKVKAEKLLPHCACDHHVELEGSLPPAGPSTSSTGAPVFFVKKKDGVLHLCVDYCKLNAVTRKNKYTVPPINQLLNVFNGSSIFSKINLCGAYNLVKIKEGDKHLTAFRTKYDSFEYLGMPFGLTNAPECFQNRVNDILQDLLDVYGVVYLDEIMVFSKSEEEHVTHVSTVLTGLRANSLFAKASKCLFHVTSVEYLGYVVSSEGLKMDQAAFQLILNFPPLRNLKALQSFLGLANFYCHFIRNYSKKISPLTGFLQKYSSFPSMSKILVSFTSSKRLSPPLQSFSTHHFLTDHSSLQYFMSSKVLTRHQAFWAEFLFEFHLSITYRPGSLATLWDDVYLERGEDFISKNTMKFPQLIKQDEVQPSRYFAVKVEYFSNFIDSIQKALWKDSQYRIILQELGKGKSVQDYSLVSSSQLLSFKDWVVVPNDPTIQLSILQTCHDSPLTGNPGQEKTLKIVKKDFHWSYMTQFIKDYVTSCQQCSRNKNIHHKKFELLKLVPIQNGPWICLTMPFITQLPLSNSFDSILVIVDRFSKTEVFIPTMSSITSMDLAHLFIKNIFLKHGLPSGIKLKISRDLSTSYHPETDGQTERVNQILEQYLWMYVRYHQYYWNTWLPLAEFAYNNSDHSSTKQSPSFTVYGRDPHFDSVHITQDTTAGNLSTKIHSVQQYVKRELEVAINRFKRNIKSTRPTKNCLKDCWALFQSSRQLAPMLTTSMEIYPSSIPYFPPCTSQDINNPKLASRASSSNHHWRRRGMGSLSNTGLKVQEQKNGIWWNGKVSVKTQKDPLGNQPKTSRIALNWSRISILYILIRQAQILQELDGERN
ncbi:hypothetical protein O181_087087 [Austropuccinia psidii MF-1]|uniref:Integrase catalytic domain-containing protein n=1 Tax=Austropuccinia psidii MF-1 TaxID=1389203 RepID=A0A9Q3P2I7_9BASI|nr:hypothetical protein [Austropuccinia psidii MF-1]